MHRDSHSCWKSWRCPRSRVGGELAAGIARSECQRSSLGSHGARDGTSALVRHRHAPAPRRRPGLLPHRLALPRRGSPVAAEEISRVCGQAGAGEFGLSTLLGPRGGPRARCRGMFARGGEPHAAVGLLYPQHRRHRGPLGINPGRCRGATATSGDSLGPRAALLLAAPASRQHRRLAEHLGPSAGGLRLRRRRRRGPGPSSSAGGARPRWRCCSELRRC
mmetsp:Transcript_67322/g.170782  ORF Transcript_67322/g.170782 Transcript_67322/m.170782 type:complete len:220 (+) Transcript_67322:158-817(+)